MNNKQYPFLKTKINSERYIQILDVAIPVIIATILLLIILF